jgi:hypothetical protein
MHEGFGAMLKGVRLTLLLVGLIFLAGCAGKIPHMLARDFDKQGARLVAVLPVLDTQSNAAGTASVLRAKLVEELYFKGYPKIPLKWIDERLALVPAGGREGELTPQRLGEMLNVDAVLYTTLKESPTSVSLLYSPVAIDAEFELKSSRTGESLWRVRHSTVYRNFGFTRKSLELKACQVYEPAIEELLSRVLETMPDGPDAAGS